jgi:uncharacterized protein
MNKQIVRSIILLLSLWLIWNWLSHLVAEILWFQEVNYLSIFLKRFQTQVDLWVITFSLSASFLLGNLKLANRLKNQKSVNQISRKNQLGSTIQKRQAVNNNIIFKKLGNELPFRAFLPIALALSLVVAVMLLQLLKVATQWYSHWLGNSNRLSLLPHFNWTLLPQHSWQDVYWQLGMLVAVVVGIIIKAQFCLNAIAFLVSLCFGFVLSGHWSQVLEYLESSSFNIKDPVFKNDISFYVFNLPLWQLLDFWLGGLFLFALVAVTLLYLLSANSISEGKFSGFSQNQLRHLFGLGSTIAAITAFHYWLQRYELLYLTTGTVYGAGYTDVKVSLPVHIALSILALAIAFFLLWCMIFWNKNRSLPSKKIAICLTLLFISANWLLPIVVQRLVVQPNELAREKTYLSHSIAFTRAAFDLNNVEVQTFDPQGKLKQIDLKNNELTIRNIRLWDTLPLLQTNRQLQQIRLYYKFFNADIDRYTLKIDNEKQDQQVIIAARELDYNAVPQQAKTWINKHLVYTHGYGFTMSPVNKVTSGGLPDYFVKDIGTSTRVGDNKALQTASENIRSSIPIGIPRIYYGELADTYVMTSTKVKEFDYPSGNDNAYNIYDGKGGVAINSWWRRGIFASVLRDWQMIFTNNFTPETRLLFRRNIKERIQAIAPFFRYDSDPYLVVADGREAGEGTSENFLYWVVDAYTTSDRYPYSDPGKNQFNYIRNSVKVVIDAYNGDVDFYIADSLDPIVKTWQTIFPSLFKSIDTMPIGLRKHIRYPEDLFSVQSERLLNYHMTDPQVFYNREDQWEIPTEIYGNKPQSVEPYYLIMKLPTQKSEEFVLLHPFTPTKRNNLIAWLAARSDGENYGKLLLYRFPKQRLVYGTQQIEARINQDPEISGQISLWNREGSRVIQGNLLVIPIERSLLYVEPIYLEAERNSLPTLVRVIVAYENKIAMAETLEQALQAIFQPNKPTTPPIVRPVGEPAT